jgi:chloramphenicol-sensitive protein RarD
VVAFYLISINGHNDFTLSNPPMMLFIFLAGPMTVIPLFLYVRGVELCGLGPTGMIFLYNSYISIFTWFFLL